VSEEKNTKLDPHTTLVPLGWVLSGFGTILAAVIVGTFWISTVNYRLQRIEERLGIAPYKPASMIEEANAK
jgi:CTP-dependent riboflavin kinase